MNKNTLAALRKSIRHWEDNVNNAENGEYVSTSSGRCALCGVFGSCAGCPVFEKTGKNSCVDTPYWKVVTVKNSSSSFIILPPRKEMLVSACREELEFLRGLLPVKKGK